MDSRRARVRVAVLTAMLVLGACVVAWWRERGERPQAEDVTEPAGPAVVPPPLAAAPARARTAAGAEPADAAPRATEGAEAAWAAPVDPAERPPGWPDVRTVRVRVEAVDALTGATLDVRWRLIASADVPTLPGLPLVSDEAHDPRVRDAGSVAAAAVPHPRLQVGAVLWPVPSGYVVPVSALVPRPVDVEPDTTDLVMRVPLAPVATLEVVALGPDGAPAVGARVARVDASREYPVMETSVAPADAHGRLRIEGIPALPGERVAVWFTWTGGLRPAPDVGERAVRPPPMPIETDEVAVPDEAPLVTRVPEDGRRRWSETVRLSAPTIADAELSDHNEFDNDLPTEESLRAGDERERGRIVVRAKTVDAAVWGGADVRGTGIASGRTDDAGLLTTDVRAGRVRVTARALGHLPAEAEVEVARGEAVAVDLVEPRGARISVAVVDERGEPLPFAHVEVDGARVDAVRGVQRVDDRTDEQGRRTWPRVEAGSRVVRARWGRRFAQATVEAADGAAADVRLVLAPR